MSKILGFDHVALTVANANATCAFYDRLFGTEVRGELVENGHLRVRQIAIGGAVLSVHQAGNGVALVARRPTPGAADFCLCWDGPIESAIGLLRDCEVPMVAGPEPRRDAAGRPVSSVYFHDPDGNLVELMAHQ